MERTEIDAVRRMPLADFLARLGHEPVRRSGNELWYLAPYRGERTSSFRVNVAKQLWYDFGLGKGGDIFTLAGEFLQSDDFMKQAKFIAEAAAPLTADGVFRGTGHPLRHRIPSLLPLELRCAWETVFCRWLSEHGRWL